MVDLGANSDATSGPVYATNIRASDASANAPFRIVDAEAEPCPLSVRGMTAQMQVDSGRLYWLSVASAAPSSPDTYTLRSCSVDDCAASVVTSAPISTDLVNSCKGGYFPRPLQLDALPRAGVLRQ
jgi:hypothetical protein